MLNVLILVIISTLIGAFGSILLKKGSKEFNLNPFKQIKNWKIILGLSLYVVSSIIYIVALKFEKLSIVYPLVSLQYVWISILAQRFLNEKMNKLKWIGITLIMLGITMINV